MASMRESRDSDRFQSTRKYMQSQALLHQGFGTSVPFIRAAALHNSISKNSEFSLDWIYSSIGMKGTEVPNPRRSNACDCTCVLTRIDHCLVTLMLAMHILFCSCLPGYAKFTHEFLTLFHRPSATYPELS